MGKFVITKPTTTYRFNLNANNGETILTSESYTTKAGCFNGIESVKTNSTHERYDKKISKDSKYYFNLISANGRIIGTSEMYDSVAGRDNGIESVKRTAPTAKIDDHTI